MNHLAIVCMWSFCQKNILVRTTQPLTTQQQTAWINVLLSIFPSCSTDINVRAKRSQNSGCKLGTCTVHDLAHRLFQLNRQKLGNAPLGKIEPKGYGRRRRSLPAHRVTLRLEKGRLRPAWSRTGSQVHKLEALLRQT